MNSTDSSLAQERKKLNIDVFISYSSKNSIAAKAICHALEENGIRCWMAPRDIPAGCKYGDMIDTAIDSAKVFLLVYSADSLKSPWCNGELNVAFTEGKTIVPYRIDEAPLEGAMRVMLNQTHWIDSYPNYRQCFAELVKTISSIVDVRAEKETAKESERKEKSKAQTSIQKNDSDKLSKKEWVIVVVCSFFGALGLLAALILHLLNMWNTKNGKPLAYNPKMIRYICFICLAWLAFIGIVTSLSV